MTSTSRICVFLLFAGSLVAQDRPVFDVISIKPYEGSNDLVYARTSPGGLAVMEGQTVLSLITASYGVRRYQVTGAPDWTDQDRFNISARAESITGPFPVELLWPRVRTMLEDRFALKARRETREMPIYALVVDKGGAKLKRSAGTDTRYRVSRGMIAAGKS